MTTATASGAARAPRRADRAGSIHMAARWRRERRRMWYRRISVCGSRWAVLAGRAIFGSAALGRGRRGLLLILLLAVGSVRGLGGRSLVFWWLGCWFEIGMGRCGFALVVGALLVRGRRGWCWWGVLVVVVVRVEGRRGRGWDFVAGGRGKR